MIHVHRSEIGEQAGQVGGDLLDNLAGCARTAQRAEGIQKGAEILDELPALYLLLRRCHEWLELWTSGRSRAQPQEKRSPATYLDGVRRRARITNAGVSNFLYPDASCPSLSCGIG